MKKDLRNTQGTNEQLVNLVVSDYTVVFRQLKVKCKCSFITETNKGYLDVKTRYPLFIQ